MSEQISTQTDEWDSIHTDQEKQKTETEIEMKEITSTDSQPLLVKRQEIRPTPRNRVRVAKEIANAQTKDNFLGPTQLGYMGLSFGSFVVAVLNLGLWSENIQSLYWFVLIPAILVLLAAILSYLLHNNLEASIFFVLSVFLFAVSSTWVVDLWDNLNPLPPGKMRLLASFFVTLFIFLVFFTFFTLQMAQMIFWLFFSLSLAMFFLIFRIIYSANNILVGVPLIMTTCLSVYLSVSLTLNNLVGKQVLPLGNPLYNWSNFNLHLTN
ncbi:inner membrane protein yaah [Anaeramoeba ignava]|uniref:Inner membrane protein yaah n=1 Tax=Anaeramoeba ignava TaxID=1746090 RepID=A0A9Q0LBY3_ANAIG|nr:inner membrane protein yaah [Anaeramoeba ignava]